jgi:hypothetical protein
MPTQSESREPHYTTVQVWDEHGQPHCLEGDSLEALAAELNEIDPELKTKVLNRQGFTAGWIGPHGNWRHA